VRGLDLSNMTLVEGDAGVIQRLLGLLDQPDPGFPIVTP
jgi:alkyl sulfatase BDS1-like metallo-beta-lactamase superfamily hydrolase